MRRKSRILPALCLALTSGLVLMPSVAANLLQQNTGARITGVVVDPNGAVVPGAKVTLREEATGTSRTAATDNQGRFALSGLAAGRYRLSIAREGFRTAEETVAVETDKTAAVKITLVIAETRGEVSVAGKGSVLPNSDANYKALREARPHETYAVTNLVLKRDIGVLTLRSGNVTFLSPVLGRASLAVFVGEGEFTLEPVISLERAYMRFLTGKESFSETFNRMVICFTDGTAEEIKKLGPAAEVHARAVEVLRDFRRRMRNSTDTPRSMIEAILASGDVENLDSETLAALYNPRRGGSFNAYIFGKKYQDLRFLVRPEGVFPSLPAPEEVALIHLDPQGKEEGILYLGH